MKTRIFLLVCLVHGLAFGARSATLRIQNPQVIYSLKNGAVESTGMWLPAGLLIRTVGSSQAEIYKVRGPDGKEKFSSTGFVRVESVELELDLKPGTAIYISALAVQDQSSSGTFPALSGAKKFGKGYESYYSIRGQPKRTYSISLKRRFGSKLNKAIAMSSLPKGEQEKWQRIFTELQRAGNREQEAPKSLLVIDNQEAMNRALAFEKNGAVFTEGAWSIAVNGTAKRHGFQHVPCAEFMSEVLRQAYRRAGYSHFEDFNDDKKNRLDMRNGAAAVITLASYMNKAGWIPWDAAKYVPPVGAIIMHTTASWPGHTYMSGGDNGQIIVDNSKPAGRDLRQASRETLGMMYQHGTFFLPPGIVPEPWSKVR